MQPLLLVAAGLEDRLPRICVCEIVFIAGVVSIYIYTAGAGLEGVELLLLELLLVFLSHGVLQHAVQVGAFLFDLQVHSAQVLLVEILLALQTVCLEGVDLLGKLFGCVNLRHLVLQMHVAACFQLECVALDVVHGVSVVHTLERSSGTRDALGVQSFVYLGFAASQQVVVPVFLFTFKLFAVFKGLDELLLDLGLAGLLRVGV